ncbi:MAG: dihydrolipoyl dehydrogenase [Candidatus Kapaibacterium sp.]|jgi:dihydrolipoamide dehydrogenase|nr:dihydrolipoyl dehydrogenase [Candidatus Kapabacteria bacterium]
MANHQCDVVVIGSGPGGYVAAIRASQLGLKAICVEREALGGVCLNIGCIPTKALLKSAEYAHFMDHAGDFGFDFDNLSINYPQVIDRSRKVATQMSKGVSSLFKKYKVESVFGWGKVRKDKVVEVTDKDGKVTDTIQAKNIIIATGARPRLFQGIEVDHKNIITSTDALLGKHLPKSIVVMGAGAIGVEFAYFFNAFGANVTIVEYMDRILPIEDVDVSKELERHFRKSKIDIKTKSMVKSAKAVDGGVEVTIETNGKTEVIKAEMALNAIGIQANIENIGLEELGIKTEKGFIKIDEFCKTNVDGIYSIGDVAGPPWLAHKASAEAVVCAEYIAGHNPKGIDYGNIPGCTYCNPQVASVGLTEEKAKAAGHDVKIGKFPFLASGKAHGIGEAKGFVKLVFDAKYGELLGAHMIGPDVTEMVAELGLARSLEATAETIFKTIHAHPTLSEAVMEAAAQAYGEAVNI